MKKIIAFILILVVIFILVCSFVVFCLGFPQSKSEIEQDLNLFIERANSLCAHYNITSFEIVKADEIDKKISYMAFSENGDYGIYLECSAFYEGFSNKSFCMTVKSGDSGLFADSDKLKMFTLIANELSKFDFDAGEVAETMFSNGKKYFGENFGLTNNVRLLYTDFFQNGVFSYDIDGNTIAFSGKADF